MGAVTTDLTAKPQQGEEALRREVRTMLHVDSSNPGRLLSRENSRLEYKATFNWGSRAKYAKSMAAFANNIGGLIVFGVKNSPRDIVGVNSKRFNELDPSKVAMFLNSAFAPELDWEAFQIEVSEFTLGIFSVRPAVRRPVICTKTHGKELRAADIYYRYNGSSERIRFPELEKLLAERQDRERDAWLEHLSHVARVGIENVGVLDLMKGQISGPGGRLLVAEELLDKVQFIREGRFVESLGDGGTNASSRRGRTASRPRSPHSCQDN